MLQPEQQPCQDSRPSARAPPGSRPSVATRGPGKDWGLSIYTPVIVKYRDARTDAKLQLEDLLR
jgi:2,3,4,5-tetrahydropyridine-2-carboxylate N-succinyltransferase